MLKPKKYKWLLQNLKDSAIGEGYLTLEKLLLKKFQKFLYQMGHQIVLHLLVLTTSNKLAQILKQLLIHS